MCLCRVWSVSICYHLPRKLSSLSLHQRTCSLSTDVVSDCDGSINVFSIRCKPEWQWMHALFHFQAYLARLGVGMLTVGFRVSNATYKSTFCAKVMCFAFHMMCAFVSVRLISPFNSLTSNLRLFQMGSSIAERWNVFSRRILGCGLVELVNCTMYLCQEVLTVECDLHVRR